MAVNIPTLKKALALVQSEFNLSQPDAVKVIATYQASDTLNDILAGDFSTIPAAAAAAGVNLGDASHISGEESARTSKQDTTPRKESSQTKSRNASTTKQGIPQTKKKKAAEKNPAKKIPVVNGEIIPTIQAEIIGDELPPDFAETVESWLEEFKTKAGFDDLTKIANIQWRALCLSIGERIQKSGILRDKERERTRGGKIYNPYRVAALVPIWEKLTSYYKHIPLAVDFVAFSGVSREWFYDTQERLTSTRVDIAKKVRNIEESALSAAIADARENPTGRIFYAKARHGWRETSEIIHTSAKETQAAGALPMFDDSGALLGAKS